MKKTILLLSALLLLCGTLTVYAFAAPPPSESELLDTENLPATPATNTAIMETAEEDIVPDRELYEPYAAFGLLYRESTRKLYYNGALVRCFDDLTQLDRDSTIGIGYYCEAGTVDVSAERDTGSITRNPDGSFDPRGKLTGLRLHTPEEFAARDLTLLKRDADTVAASTEGEAATPEALAESYAEYEPFGVTYDKGTDTLYFRGEPVRTIMDVMASDGGSPEGGSFSGTLRCSGSKDGGTVDIYTVRDFDRPDVNGFGKLTGIQRYSQEDFERRTDATWTQTEA